MRRRIVQRLSGVPVDAGVELLRWRKAGDYIDPSAASITGERAKRIRMLKEEAFHFNGYFSDKTSQVMGVYYDEMIPSLVTEMKETFNSARKKPKFSRPLPMVLTAVARRFLKGSGNGSKRS